VGRIAHKKKNILIEVEHSIYIGGEFSSEDLSQILNPQGSHSADFFFPSRVGARNRSFFESGADSLAFVLSNIKTDALVLWAPDNFCYESLHRVQQKVAGTQIEVKSYALGRSIKFETDKLNVLLIAYFNCYDPDLFSALKTGSHGVITIEDFTHAPLDIANTKADHSFGSLRKFIPLSVSVTYSTNTPALKSENESAYLKIKKTASEIKAATLEDPAYAKEDLYLTLFRLAESQLNSPVITSAHQTQIEAFQYIDFEKIHRIRKDNYNFLLDKIQNHPALRGIMPGDYMYFMIRTKDQQKLRKHFFTHGIFPVIHWPDSRADLSKEILSFHIDHRYRPSVLERIFLAIKSFEKQ
jgi:hypothetical protein